MHVLQARVCVVEGAAAEPADCGQVVAVVAVSMIVKTTTAVLVAMLQQTDPCDCRAKEDLVRMLNDATGLPLTMRLIETVLLTLSFHRARQGARR
jgi:hypothetical protein